MNKFQKELHKLILLDMKFYEKFQMEYKSIIGNYSCFKKKIKADLKHIHKTNKIEMQHIISLQGYIMCALKDN